MQDVFVEGELGPGQQQAGLARPRDELFRCGAVLRDVGLPDRIAPIFRQPVEPVDE